MQHHVRWLICFLLIAVNPACLYSTELTFRDSAIDTTQDGFDPEMFGPWDISPAYGDNVSGTTQTGVNDGAYVWDFTYGAAGGPTPNVTTTYNTVAHYSESGYGDLIGVVWSDSDIDLSLDAAPGFFVVLQGLDLAGFLEDRPETTVSILDVAAGNIEVYNSGSQTVDGTAHSIFGVDGTGAFGFAPLISEQLRIIVSGPSVPGGGVGIDNIQFGQLATAAPALPEPSALALHAIGGVFFLIRSLRFQNRG